MYGRWEGELWFHRWHMWPVPSSSTPSVAAPSNSFVLIDTNSFSKDGRTIHVGDCALFLPSQNSLPFVGIIRKLKKAAKDNNNNLTLSVNWLYRPADIKLKEGASFEAAPNEVFYSFHKDEIPAASLLHPCKVSFLPKGSQLPSGLSSFVCRRVYDIETQRLWWLTDQNYLNSYLTQKRQQEVNKLLDKTRVEMYGAVQTQTGARSPKPLTGQPQVKPSSDNVQNSSSSISSHAKSKKRDHNGHKSKVDDADSGQQKSDHFIRTEINKITEKGGITDSHGVDKLIQLMKPENTDKKLDLSTRSLLVDVISVTESFDCLTRFVQVKGLSILDEWLQEIHKGKIGNLSPKETDKSIEEFLFSLLRALDRLPVNLHALQTCNVGKSVNHLRSHKNQEIQKKARSLVSTWKRRVEAEMTMIETKSSTSRGGGSWPTRRSTSTSQPSPLKNSGDPAAKSPPSKVAVTGGGSSDIKECSSNQSPNSQSCSSDHGKTGGTSSLSKISSGVFNSRNSSNGFHGVGGQKGNLGKSQNEKEHVSERVSEMSIVDNGNNNQNNVPEPSEKVSGKVEGKDGCEEVKSVTVTVVLPCDENNGSSSVTPKQGNNNNKLYEASYSSINALVESCAKFSEATSVSPSDDGGMNLLASVAAGEMSRDDVDPTCSPPLPEDSCSANVNKLKREDNLNVANGPHVEEDSKDMSESVIPIPIPTSDVKMEDRNGDDKVTQINEESASWSSSDINEDEKKKVNDRSRLLEDSQGGATTSCGEGDLVMKCEEVEEKNRDSGVKSETETGTVKLDFDLNEDIPIDEEAGNSTFPSSNSPVNGNRSPLVTVPAKGPFYPSENLSRTKSELGWKGSAATSAFRPAVKPARPLLDFDLNVGVDDSAQNDNSGIGIDLDLNAIEPPEPVQFPPRANPSNSSRGFDLNGPGVVEEIEFPKKGIQFVQNVPNVRGVNPSSSWLPPTNTFTIPSIEQQQQQQQQNSYNARMLSPVLQSTPAVVPFQYSPFPFETNFPLPNTFMDVPAGVGTVPGGMFPAQGQMVSMPYRPSYFMSLPGGSSNVGKWGSPGGSLDLNAGPTEEQIKMFQQLAGAPGGKRKEPDSGWDYKQQHPAWQ